MNDQFDHHSSLTLILTTSLFSPSSSSSACPSFTSSSSLVSLIGIVCIGLLSTTHCKIHDGTSVGKLNLCYSLLGLLLLSLCL